MSRHRNVRSMNYTDEYDGYDDVYGHSVEDDYCVSPSEAAFMYDREGPKGKQKIGVFFERDNDIAEENEIEAKEANLSDIDRARLETCIEHIREMLNITPPRQHLIDVVLLCNFNVERAIKCLLDTPEYKDNKQEKDFKFSLKTKKGFTIPKLNTKLTNSTRLPSESKNYSTLADLTSHHLNKVGFKKKTFEKKLDVVLQRVSSINLDEKPIKSLNNIENGNGLDGNWHIDLTKALRITKSAPQIRLQLPQAEKFVPQFVDCERDIPNVKTGLNNCCMDISYILKVKLQTSKRPSKFAKIICAKYKMPKLSFEWIDNDTKHIAPFAFDAPSPDDIIKQHLGHK